MPRGTARSAGGLVAAACLAVTLLAGAPAPGGAAASAQAAPRPCSRGLVALTFDDGPAVAVTGRLLDVLGARRVPATFFVVGQRVAAAPALARRAYRRGFVLGNHTYAHEMLTGLSDAGIRSTLQRTAKAMRKAGVHPSRLMRPPYGAVDSRVRTVVAGMGLVPVLWDVDPRDWDSGDSADIAARVLGALRPGGSNIVLLHDGVQRSPITLGAVPAIVSGARARGYCFAALGPSGRPAPPVPKAGVGDATVTEADPGAPVTLRFRVRLDRPTSRRVSVRVRTVDGTATAGTDYAAVDRRVEFPVGTVAREVTVRVRGDRVDEVRERLRLRLSASRGLTVGDATGVGTIRDDDPPPGLRLGDLTVVEPATGSVVTPLALGLDRPSSRRVAVVLETVPVEADQTDYVPFRVRLVLLPGERRLAIPVEVLSDAVPEPVETFQVHVVSATRATVTDGVGVVTISPPPPG